VIQHVERGQRAIGKRARGLVERAPHARLRGQVHDAVEVRDLDHLGDKTGVAQITREVGVSVEGVATLRTVYAANVIATHPQTRDHDSTHEAIASRDEGSLHCCDPRARYLSRQ
jgi:hypothetical protein